MYLRNLMSMDTEEMIRAQPMDAVVLIGGCDKTVPAQLMGAASAGIPAIQLVTGPMLTGSHRGERVGACTDCRRYWGRYRADEIDAAEIAEVNDQLAPTVGTCSVMGTASTMACIAEALGMSLPGGGSPPATTADRMRVAEHSGRRGRGDGAKRRHHRRDPDAGAFENAMRVLLAIGGSTNGIVHLTAIAGRLGIDIDLEALDRMGRETPVLVDLKPSGEHYMEHFHEAGGMPRLLRELRRCSTTSADRHRPHAGRGDRRRRRRARADRDPHAGDAALADRRHRGAARQPRAGRRDHQAVGGLARADGARRPRRGVRERRGPGARGSTIPRST